MNNAISERQKDDIPFIQPIPQEFKLLITPGQSSSEIITQSTLEEEGESNEVEPDGVLS